MIYTIGNKTSYDAALADESQTPVLKVGVRDDYPGGIVFRTEKEARENCLEGYDVYGLEADWDRDTYWSTCDGGYRALRIDRPVRSL